MVENANVQYDPDNLPDADKAKVSTDGKLVILGKDLYLPAKTGYARFREENYVTDIHEIELDSSTHFATVEPIVAVYSALGLISLHDMTIFTQQAELERIRRERPDEPIVPGMTTDFTEARQILVRHVSAIGEIALGLFPEHSRDPDGYVAQLAYEITRL